MCINYLTDYLTSLLSCEVLQRSCTRVLINREEGEFWLSFTKVSECFVQFRSWNRLFHYSTSIFMVSSGSKLFYKLLHIFPLHPGSSPAGLPGPQVHWASPRNRVWFACLLPPTSASWNSGHFHMVLADYMVLHIGFPMRLGPAGRPGHVWPFRTHKESGQTLGCCLQEVFPNQTNLC